MYGGLHNWCQSEVYLKKAADQKYPGAIEDLSKLHEKLAQLYLKDKCSET